MQTASRDKCTGCGACANVCTVGAIVMTADKSGFAYPVIDNSKCIDCGGCGRVCPVGKRRESDILYSGFACAADDETVRQSSSGGVFSVLAGKVTADGGVVFGAAFDESFSVVHMPVQSSDKLGLLRGSKYVQSDMTAVYPLVREYLDSGKTVLFSGCPCQAAGLKSYVGDGYDKLIIVDLVCHGVASPKLFAKYLDYMGKMGTVTEVCFRDKTEGYSHTDIRVAFGNAPTYRRYLPDDPYMLAYLQNISLRDCCTRCEFRSSSRVSDITLGDGWGNDAGSNGMAAGSNLVMIHTDRGQRLFMSISSKLKTAAADMTAVKSSNPALEADPRENPLTHRYYADIDRLSLDKLTNKYCGSSPVAKLRRAVARLKGKYSCSIQRR